MALPLPKVVADVEAGGPLVTGLQGINALTKSNVEAQYAPLTVPAEGLSKLAYANFMQPQYLAKLMGNENFVANLNPQQREAAKQLIYGAGTGQTTGNSLLNIPSLMESVNQSPLQRIVNSVKKAFDFGGTSSTPTQGNALLQNQPNLSQQDRTAIGQQQPGQTYTIQGNNANASTYDKNGNNVTSTPQEVSNIANNGNTPKQDDYANNAARFKSIIKEGEELGNERGKAIADVGKQQLDLSNSGVILDRLTQITQNPEFQKMRDQIPYFQDKQLWYLSKNGTPEQQKMIGDLISTAQAFKASTVNSFKGKALEKEFNLADKIKIDENDTMGVIQGKLQSLRTLKEIAETKNDFILGYMTDDHLNLGEATKRANKLVSTKDIEEKVNNILNPPVTIMYKNNQKYHIPNDKVEAAKKAGYTNGR